MKRIQKQNLIATAARNLATEISGTTQDNCPVELKSSTAGVAIHNDGTAGNIFGVCLIRASFGGKVTRSLDSEDSLRMALGMKLGETLPEVVVATLNALDSCGSSDLPFDFRLKQTVEALGLVADSLDHNLCGRPVGRPKRAVVAPVVTTAVPVTESADAVVVEEVTF